MSRPYKANRRYRALKSPAARRRHASIAAMLYQKEYQPRDYGSVDPAFDRAEPEAVARGFLRAEGVRI